MHLLNYFLSQVLISTRSFTLIIHWNFHSRIICLARNVSSSGIEALHFAVLDIAEQKVKIHWLVFSDRKIARYSRYLKG